MRTILFNVLTGASLVAAAPTQLSPRASKVQYAGESMPLARICLLDQRWLADTVNR